jgi:hypothetical protein
VPKIFIKSILFSKICFAQATGRRPSLTQIVIVVDEDEVPGSEKANTGLEAGPDSHEAIVVQDEAIRHAILDDASSGVNLETDLSLVLQPLSIEPSEEEKLIAAMQSIDIWEDCVGE